MLIKRGVLLGVILTVCGACVHPAKKPYPLKDQPATSIYLVSHGWHAGIVIHRSDIPKGLWPETGDFPQADYLEVGWGDRDFYPAPRFSVGLALKAALWPTASVLHVVGFSGPVTRYFPNSEMIELKLSRRGAERLSRYIHDSFDRQGTVRAAPSGSGLYGNSRFYPARGRFHLFNTCNTWTAGALRAAGYPISTSLTITTGQVMAEARPFGEVVQEPLNGSAAEPMEHEL